MEYDKGKILLDMIVAADSIKDAAKLIYKSAKPGELNKTMEDTCKKFFAEPLAVEEKKEPVKEKEVAVIAEQKE